MRECDHAVSQEPLEKFVFSAAADDSAAVVVPIEKPLDGAADIDDDDGEECRTQLATVLSEWEA